MDEGLWVDGTSDGRAAGENRSVAICENSATESGRMARGRIVYFGLLGLLGELAGLSAG